METKTKPERVKWVFTNAHVILDDAGNVIADCARGFISRGDSRQIVHEHNTWGELLETCKDLVALYSHVAPYGQSPVVGAAKAAIAAAEKENQ